MESWYFRKMYLSNMHVFQSKQLFTKTVSLITHNSTLPENENGTGCLQWCL